MNDRMFSATQAHRLDDPARRVWLPPAQVLDVLALYSGETIADVGAGTGYFSLPMAHSVGPQGKVYAVDGQDEMLALLRRKLDEAGVCNVELICAEADNTELPASSCDLFFVANVWHELDDRAAVLQESRRVLKPGGRIAILDWCTDVEPEPGPPLAHRLDVSKVADELRSIGFKQIESVNVGRYSWLIQGELQR
ncbi:MAG: class I SAM-dependent methyltransferase [Terracidiphilus sp.]|nr:class I SAM-dependent methyltransferase [Terracidiphilus sp.]